MVYESFLSFSKSCEKACFGTASCMYFIKLYIMYHTDKDRRARVRAHARAHTHFDITGYKCMCVYIARYTLILIVLYSCHF